LLRYEEICQEFLDAAESAGLLVFGVHHIMDVITCDREFRCTCVNDESEPPYQVRAEIGFTWDALMTAESNYSEDYPFCKEPLLGQRSFINRISPETFIDLEVRICFETLKFEEAGVLARRIQHLINNLINHDNQPQIKFEVSILPEGRVVVHDSYIYYCWHIDFQDDSVDFAPVCDEVRNILEVLVNSSLFG